MLGQVAMMADVGYLGRGRNQACLALAATCLLALSWLLIPVPLLPVGIVLGAFAAVIAINRPFLTCLIFVALSFFRIHEAYPVLYPLHLPLGFAIVTTIALIWHIFLTRSIEPFWSGELKIFAILFLLVTFGIAYAVDRRLALDQWLSVYSKVGVMTVAIAWLARAPRDFELLARVFVVSGLLIAAVAIYNKHAGIGMVELTRVTISRDLKSTLGDPNDLALVLLFPLSFSIALAVHRAGAFNRALGLVSMPALMLAITYTQSRGGLLGVLAVFAVFGLRLVRSKILLGLLVVFTALALYSAMGITDRVSGGAAEPGIDESASARLDTWMAAVNMALARPLTGVGLANFAPSLFYYAESFPGRDLAAHSTWFSALGETGLPGLVALVAMVIAAFRSSLRARHALHSAGSPEIVRAVAFALVAALAGFCVAGSFLSQAFSWPIYILLALAAALWRYAKQATDLSAHSDR